MIKKYLLIILCISSFIKPEFDIDFYLAVGSTLICGAMSAASFENKEFTPAALFMIPTFYCGKQVINRYAWIESKKQFLNSLSNIIVN